MKLDTDQAWCKIYPSGEDLKREMLEVANHTITTREPNIAWAEDLRFITPYKPRKVTPTETPTDAEPERANSPGPDASSSSSSSSTSSLSKLPTRKDYWKEVTDDYDKVLERMDGDGEKAEDGTTFTMRLAGAIQEALEEYDRKEKEKEESQKGEYAKYVIGLLFPELDMDKVAERASSESRSSRSDVEEEEEEQDPGEGPSDRTRDQDVGSNSDTSDRSPESGSDEMERETRYNSALGLGLYDWETPNAPVYLGKLEDNPQSATRSYLINSRPKERYHHGSSKGEEAIPLREDFDEIPRDNNDHESRVSDNPSTSFDSGDGRGKSGPEILRNEALTSNASQSGKSQTQAIETQGDPADKSGEMKETPEPQSHNEESIELQTKSPADSSSFSSSSIARCECSYIPNFAQGPSPPIRLMRNPDLTECTHFIAVSYCWQSSLPPTSPDPNNAEWTIQNSRTTAWLIRAPRRTLKRALDYAKMVDVGLIWIDQECIEQDDPTEKELAIHSMDLVYQRAKYPIGLLDSYINSQGELDAFDIAMNGDVHDEHQLEDLALILETLANDLWFTRGWILQESTSTGLSMVLLLQHDPGLERRFAKPSIRGEICFDLLDLAKMSERLHRDFCDDWFFDHPEPRIRARKKHGGMDFACTPRYEGIAISPEIRSRILKAAQRLMNVCMSEERAIPRSRQVKSPRKQYSAARALEILGSRKTSIVSDRIAILGNLCNYKIRLDTTKISLDKFSFSVCALTLAILNGDMSLLPEFAGQADGNKNWIWNKPDDGFSWLPKYTENLDILPKSMVDEHWCGIQGLKLIPDGLRIPGWLWVVDRKVDMSALRAKYNDIWFTYFDVPPTRPRRDPEFNYPYKGPRGSYIDFIIHFLWDLLVDLFIRDEISLYELLWTQLRQEVGHSDHDHLTNTSIVRTEPLPTSFRRVVYKSHSTIKLHSELRGVSVEHPLRDLILSGNISINWVIDQILRHGYLHIGHCINSNAISRKHEDSAVLFQAQKMGNYFTPLSLLSVSDDEWRVWPKWVGELTWKVEWMQREVQGLQVFRTRRLFSGIAIWSRHQSMEDEVILE